MQQYVEMEAYPMKDDAKLKVENLSLSFGGLWCEDLKGFSFLKADGGFNIPMKSSDLAMILCDDVPTMYLHTPLLGGGMYHLLSPFEFLLTYNLRMC